MQYGTLKPSFGLQKAMTCQGWLLEPTHWKNSLKSSRLPFRNCFWRMAFLSRLAGCRLRSRRNVPNLRMLPPDGGELHAASQIHPSEARLHFRSTREGGSRNLAQPSQQLPVHG